MELLRVGQAYDDEMELPEPIDRGDQREDPEVPHKRAEDRTMRVGERLKIAGEGLFCMSFVGWSFGVLCNHVLGSSVNTRQLSKAMMSGPKEVPERPSAAYFVHYSKSPARLEHSAWYWY
jgi:hypothetical protein